MVIVIILLQYPYLGQSKMADENIYKQKQHSLELDTIENTCDVMNGNSSEETNKNVLDKSKDTLQYNELKEKANKCEVIIHNSSTNDKLAHQNQPWSTNANSGDVVCLGATLIIVIIQLSVLVFYVLKEYGFYKV